MHFGNLLLVSDAIAYRCIDIEVRIRHLARAVVRVQERGSLLQLPALPLRLARPGPRPAKRWRQRRAQPHQPLFQWQTVRAC